MSAQEIIETSYRDLPAVVDSSQFMPIMGITQALQRRQAIVEFTKQCMTKDHDYGTIPGTPKPTLYKAGAEKLCSMFGLTPKFTLIRSDEDWMGERHGGEPFFYYLYQCSLYRGDFLIADSEGSCNSWEKKYRYRRVFGKKATEQERQKGKPVAGKYGTDYLLPNDDVSDLVNTFQKMAQKRAMIAAVLLATNASEFYTQDVEDLPSEAVISEAQSSPVQAEPEPDYAALFKAACEAHGIKATRGLIDKLLDRKIPDDANWPEVNKELCAVSEEKWQAVLASKKPAAPAAPVERNARQDALLTLWLGNFTPDARALSTIIGRIVSEFEPAFTTLTEAECEKVEQYIEGAGEEEV